MRAEREGDRETEREKEEEPERERERDRQRVKKRFTQIHAKMSLADAEQIFCQEVFLFNYSSEGFLFLFFFSLVAVSCGKNCSTIFICRRLGRSYDLP